MPRVSHLIPTPYPDRGEGEQVQMGFVPLKESVAQPEVRAESPSSAFSPPHSLIARELELLDANCVR